MRLTFNDILIVGPPCLPILGSIPFMKTNNFHFYLQEIKEKYGPVIGFKVGMINLIGVVGTKEVNEVFTRPEFQGRPQLAFFDPG